MPSHYRVSSKEFAPNWYDAMKESIAFAAQNYASDPNVAYLARHINLSESHFMRILHSQTETTPARYEVPSRIEKYLRFGDCGGERGLAGTTNVPSVARPPTETTDVSSVARPPVETIDVVSVGDLL